MNAIYIWKGGCIITPGDTGSVYASTVQRERKRRGLNALCSAPLFAPTVDPFVCTVVV